MSPRVKAIETRTTLSLHPTSVGSARRFVRDVLMTRQVDEDVVETAMLLTSEVVTNALVHARSGPTLVVRLGGDHVRVEVHDHSPAVPVRRGGELEAATGLGMTIVEELARDWGVEHVPKGKRVWFEVSTGGSGGVPWRRTPASRRRDRAHRKSRERGGGVASDSASMRSATTLMAPS